MLISDVLLNVILMHSEARQLGTTDWKKMLTEIVQNENNDMILLQTYNQDQKGCVRR